MNNLLKLNGAIGPDDEDDNTPDDVSRMQGALTELGHTPFQRGFHPDETPVREIERVQIDNDLKIDGRARPGGETERTLNNELLRKRDEDGRTFGGLLSDPRVRKPVGMAEIGKSNTVRDLARTEDALTRIGRPPRNEHRPTDLMRADAVGRRLLEVQSASGLERDGVMTPGGPTERELMRELEAKRQLAAAGDSVSTNQQPGEAVSQAIGTAAGIFERVFAPALKGVSGSGQSARPPQGPLSAKPHDLTAQFRSKNAPEEHASNHVRRDYSPQNRASIPALPEAIAAYDGRKVLFGEIKILGDRISARTGRRNLNLVEFIRRASMEISFESEAPERRTIVSRLTRELDRLMPKSDLEAVELRSAIISGMRAAASNPNADAQEIVLSQIGGRSSATASLGVANLEREVRSWVIHFRGEGKPFLADMIQKWLSGEDSDLRVSKDWLRQIADIRKGERKVQGHFEGWLAGTNLPSVNSPEERFHKDLQDLKQGDVLEKSSKWDATFRVKGAEFQSDTGMTINQTEINSVGSFEFRRDGNVFRFSGTVEHQWTDDFDWDQGKGMRVPTRKLAADQALVSPLKSYGRAKDFKMLSNWRQRVTGELVHTGGRWMLRNVRWHNAQ